MDFRLYPQPIENICTPFVFDPEKNIYSRYFLNNSSKSLVSLSLQKKINSYRVNVSGIDGTFIYGKELPNRDEIKNYFLVNKSINYSFIEFFENTIVIPTFSLSFVEAYIKTIIRQLITAKQAKKLFSDFIKNFGYCQNRIYGFPDKKNLEDMTVKDLQSIGLGFKGKRIYNGIRMINNFTEENKIELSGIGPWSKAILKVENCKSFSFYPFWDKSGEKIHKIIGIDLNLLAKDKPKLAGDLYIYAISFLEKKHESNLYRSFHDQWES